MFRFGSALLPLEQGLRHAPTIFQYQRKQDPVHATRVARGGDVAHGAQKLLGWFGGYGFDGTMNYFTGTMHIPSALAFLVIASEAFGSLGLLFGLGTRLAAFGAAATMVGAVLTTHLKVGFFMNWFGNQPGEGLEYHLLALALALPLVVRGGGAFSVDRRLFEALELRRTRSRERALRADLARQGLTPQAF